VKREACYAAVIAVAYGATLALIGGSLHVAIGYGCALLTGAFLGLGLARR
jgi:hypothetical protein